MHAWMKYAGLTAQLLAVFGGSHAARVVDRWAYRHKAAMEYAAFAGMLDSVDVGAAAS